MNFIYFLDVVSTFQLLYTDLILCSPNMLCEAISLYSIWSRTRENVIDWIWFRKVFRSAKFAMGDLCETVKKKTDIWLELVTKCRDSKLWSILEIFFRYFGNFDPNLLLHSFQYSKSIMIFDLSHLSLFNSQLEREMYFIWGYDSWCCQRYLTTVTSRFLVTRSSFQLQGRLAGCRDLLETDCCFALQILPRTYLCTSSSFRCVMHLSVYSLSINAPGSQNSLYVNIVHDLRQFQFSFWVKLRS